MFQNIFIKLSIIGIFIINLMPVSSAEDYIVGVHLPLTGAFARAGQAYREGIVVAERLHNLDSQTKVKLDIVDDESTATKAITAVEKFASSGDAAIIGGYASSIIGPASEVSNRYGVTYMTAGAVSEELTRKGLKTFFRINNNGGYARAVNGILDDLKPTKVAIFVNTRSDAPSLLAKSVGDHLKQQNIEFVEYPFDASTTNFQPLINRMRLRDKPDVILMIVYENDYIGILRAAKLIKPDVKAMVGTWSLATIKMQEDFPDLMDKVIGCAQISFPASFNDEEGQKFEKAYKEINGKDVDYQAVYGYVQAKLVFDAIDRLAKKGPFDRKLLADEMRAEEVDSLIGKVKFDETGENIHFSLRMAQHQGKELPIVAPSNVATKPIILPARPW